MENKNEENLLTIMDIKNLKDPFGNYDMDGEQAPMVSINPPNDVVSRFCEWHHCDCFRVAVCKLHPILFNSILNFSDC